MIRALHSLLHAASLAAAAAFVAVAIGSFGIGFPLILAMAMGKV